ncbi:MAG: efflux RND transporter periplasmic adaptor subunit [Phycisphaerae bacterium]
MVAGAAVLTAVLADCRRPPASGPQQHPPPVTVARATTQNVPDYLDEIGTCTAVKVVSITPQATGKIVEQHVKDGDQLTVGQKLFTIDPEPYRAALAQAEAGLRQGQASLILAQAELERSAKLYPLQAASKEDLEIKQSAVKTAQAQIDAANAAIKTANLNLAYCFIQSPLDGRAGKVLVYAGNVVTANSGIPLIVAQQMDPIYADFVIPETEIERVRGQMAAGQVQVMVRLPSEQETAARRGELTFLDNAVQQGTGTLALRATVPNADWHFWPGQFVRVRLVLRTLAGAVLVPYEAAQVSQTGHYVYVLSPDLRAEVRPVRLGQRHGELVAIAEGLAGGETVITTGQLRVRPGEKVQVLRTRTAPALPGAPAGGSSRPASAPMEADR